MKVFLAMFPVVHCESREWVSDDSDRGGGGDCMERGRVYIGIRNG